jgi:hypothetical protein
VTIPIMLDLIKHYRGTTSILELSMRSQRCIKWVKMVKDEEGEEVMVEENIHKGPLLEDNINLGI